MKIVTCNDQEENNSFELYNMFIAAMRRNIHFTKRIIIGPIDTTISHLFLLLNYQNNLSTDSFPTSD